MNVIRPIVTPAVFFLAGVPFAAASVETLTGAQLFSDARVSFPAYGTERAFVSGNSLVIGPGDLNYAKFFDLKLGAFTYTDVIEVKLNMTVLTADSDPKLVLSDGLRMYGIAIGDDNRGTMNYIRFSDNGNAGGYDGVDAGFVNGAYPAVGGSFDVTVRFSFAPASSTVYGAYANASGQFSTPQQYIDPRRELHFNVLGDNDDNEQYQINRLTLSIPAPAAVYFTGAVNNQLAAAGNYARDLAGTVVSPSVPDGASDVYFASTNAKTANLAATLGSNLTVNSLTFGPGAAAATPVTIGGASTLTLNAGQVGYAAGTGIVKQSGSAAVTINAPVALAAGQSWTNSSATALTVGGTVALGANALTIAGANAGGTTVGGAISGSGGVTVTAGGVTTLTGNNTYTGPTSVDAANGSLRVNAAAATPLLGGPSGLNIANGQVVFQYAGSSPAATIRFLLANGFQAPTTPGVMDSGQIRSGTATARRGLGYRDDGAGNVTVRATLFGDTNLDGAVLIGDFDRFVPNFGITGGRVWFDGDFNYDGAVSITDFNLLALNFGQSVPSSADWTPLVAFAAARNDLAAFAALTGVPEPTSLALSATGLTLGLRRRSRRPVTAGKGRASARR